MISMRLHTANQIEGLTPQSGSSLSHRMVMTCNNKKLKMTPPNTGGWTLEGGGLRRWDEMPGHILEQIFSRFPFEDLCKPNTFVRVCRSWFLAALDVVFPSVAILDLRVMCTLDKEQHIMYMVYLKLVLDTRPISQWTMFYHPPRTYLRPEIIIYIAKRTPCLQHLILPKIGMTQYSIYVKLMRYWRKLVVLHTEHYRQRHNLSWLASCCTNLRSLSISGCFDVKKISDMIRTLIPRLKYLSLQWSIFTVEAASLLIAEVGRGNNNRGVETLDLQHCIFFEKKIRIENLVMQHTVEVNIHEKAEAAVKNYLSCEGIKLCPKCRSKPSNIRCFSHIIRGD